MSQKAKQNLVTAFAIVLIIFGVYYVGLQIMERISGSELFGFFSGALGKELVMDDKNHTNVLLVGIGGEGHDGSDLTDTLIVASLDHTTHSVAFLSIPRDLYVETGLGGGRVNQLYYQGKSKWGETQSLDYARETIAKTLAIPIPYAVKVDFGAFEQIVDSVGGVDVYVAHAMNDPFYPKGETVEYETFILPAGMQHLDGKTALKYARSRKTTSDFDRSKRQQQLLIALKNKAAAENIFAKKRFLQELYYSLRYQVETNMSIREMLSVASFASQWNSKDLIVTTINDDPDIKGGFLYTPLRELYGGAYILLPAGDSFDAIDQFVRIILYGPPELTKVGVVILNATKESGLAGKTAQLLIRFGIDVSKTGNAISKTQEKSFWYIRSHDLRDVAETLTTLIPGDISETVPDAYLQNADFADAGIILEVGKDAKPFLKKLDSFRGIVPMKSSKPVEAASAPATTTPVTVTTSQ